jgi:hypothetical protein
MASYSVGKNHINYRLLRLISRLRRGWLWLPVPFALAYLLLLLVKFNQIVAATYLNADAASAPVIGELYGGSPAHRQVMLGNMGWFSTLLFELATRWLPIHRQLWEGAGYAMALVSVLLICLGVWMAAGRWAAAITGALLVCAGPTVIGILFSLDDHSATWFSLALLAALLVLFEAPPRWLRTWSSLAIALVAGAAIGVNAASDSLLLVGGIVPVLIAAAVTWTLRPGARSLSAGLWLLGTTIVAGAVGIFTRALMRHENVTTPPHLVHNAFVSTEAITGNFKLWWQSLMVLGNGGFFSKVLGFTSALQLVCAVLTLTALLLVLRFVWRRLGASLPRQVRAEDAEALRLAWYSFWGTSAVLLSVTFVCSSNPVDLNSSRYLVGVIYAVAALLPLLAVTRTAGRALLATGTTVFALTGLTSMLNGEELTGASSTYNLYNQVQRLATRDGLAVGYADYWDAAPLTWSTHFRLKVYPVQDCGATLCAFYLHTITSWYTPRHRQRTFLLYNTQQPVPSAPTAILGKPSATYQIGPIAMYVYPYDIAAKM